MTKANSALRWVVLALGAAGAAVFAPLWAPLVLAAWIADLVRPLARRMEHALGGRRAGAGVACVLVVLAMAAPVVVAALVFLTQAEDLWTVALHALSSEGFLAGVAGEALGVAGEAGLRSLDPGAAIDFVRQHGAALWQVLGGVATASASALIGLVVFALTLYAFIVDGARIHAWIARRSPIDAGARRRLVAAFRETGRGLLVGAGGTALAQSVVAATSYAALGVRSAIALGVLTGLFAFVPAVGTAAVWAPLAVVLAATGHPERAAILAVLGVGVIGTIDNLLRPWLAKKGSLRLPATVVFLSMMGGLRLFGGWGLVLGPLLVRLGTEALAIARERREPSGTLARKASSAT